MKVNKYEKIETICNNTCYYNNTIQYNIINLCKNNHPLLYYAFIVWKA